MATCAGRWGGLPLPASESWRRGQAVGGTGWERGGMGAYLWRWNAEGGVNPGNSSIPQDAITVPSHIPCLLHPCPTKMAGADLKRSIDPLRGMGMKAPLSQGDLWECPPLQGCSTCSVGAAESAGDGLSWDCAFCVRTEYTF